MLVALTRAFLLLGITARGAGRKTPRLGADNRSKSSGLLICDHIVWNNLAMDVALLVRERRTRKWNLFIELEKIGETRNYTAARGLYEETGGVLSINPRALNFGEGSSKPFKEFIRIPKLNGRHENVTFVVRANMGVSPRGWVQALAGGIARSPKGRGYRELDGVALMSASALYTAGDPRHQSDRVALVPLVAYVIDYTRKSYSAMVNSRLVLSQPFVRSLRAKLPLFQTLIQQVSNNSFVLVRR